MTLKITTYVDPGVNMVTNHKLKERWQKRIEWCKRFGDVIDVLAAYDLPEPFLMGAAHVQWGPEMADDCSYPQVTMENNGTRIHFRVGQPRDDFFWRGTVNTPGELREVAADFAEKFKHWRSEGRPLPKSKDGCSDRLRCRISKGMFSGERICTFEVGEVGWDTIQSAEMCWSDMGVKAADIPEEREYDGWAAISSVVYTKESDGDDAVIRYWCAHNTEGITVKRDALEGQLAIV